MHDPRDLVLVERLLELVEAVMSPWVSVTRRSSAPSTSSSRLRSLPRS